jgi:3-dehydroquinate synthase
MVVEATISERMGLLSAADAARMRDMLVMAGLPVRVPAFEMEQIFDKMASDKKNAHGILRFSLLKGLGDAVWHQEVPRVDVVAAITAHQEMK